jgi:hypothetical protein
MTEATSMAARKQSPNFFEREADGSVRIRFRLGPEEATMIEEAAGSTPLMVWLHRTLSETARRQVEAAREKRPPVGPPE